MRVSALLLSLLACSIMQAGVHLEQHRWQPDQPRTRGRHRGDGFNRPKRRHADRRACSDVVSFLNTTADNGDTARGVSLSVEEEDDIKIALPGRTETGAFRILIEGIPVTAVVLEASDKLSNWAPIATGETGPEGTPSLVDPESVNLPARFYRVRDNP
jgi:hypothetical protein